MHCVAYAHTSNNISSHWLASGPIQTTLYITPWGHCEVNSLAANDAFKHHLHPPQVQALSQAH